MSYLPVETHRTCAAAWLAAALVLSRRSRWSSHNVIVDVAEPLVETAQDSAVLRIVDSTLRGAPGAYPLSSVANTIFPQQFYERHGIPALYEQYGRIRNRLRRAGSWGTYFERMIQRSDYSGETTNPLHTLVRNLYRNVHERSRTYRNIYELTIYDPSRDSNRTMNRQCLSFLSFKLTDTNHLKLTALYRNHYYVSRLLGNLIGLARLMAFVGREANLPIGSLTIVSTHAELDIPSGMNRQGVKDLLASCEAVSKGISQYPALRYASHKSMLFRP